MNQQERRIYLIREMQREMPQYADIPIPEEGILVLEPTYRHILLLKIFLTYRTRICRRSSGRGELWKQRICRP